jgi:hypothetical protein
MARRCAALLLWALLSGVGASAFASTLDLAPRPLGAEARLAALDADLSTPVAPGEGLTQSGQVPKSMPGPGGAALRSLLIPGWGQLATGHKTQAAVFFGLEVATWTTYATFRHQGSLRRDSYFDTARLFAGIDLADVPESYRKLVGQYRSSDVYNQYVVLREATYFYSDSTERAQYIESRSIPDANAWSWGDSYDEFLRYRAERRSSEQSFKNAQYTLGFAIINRVVSAIAAARTASGHHKAEADAVGEGAQPGHPTARLAWAMSPGAGFVPDARVACVVRF